MPSGTWKIGVAGCAKQFQSLTATLQAFDLVHACKLQHCDSGSCKQKTIVVAPRPSPSHCVGLHEKPRRTWTVKCVNMRGVLHNIYKTAAEAVLPPLQKSAFAERACSSLTSSST